MLVKPIFELQTLREKREPKNNVYRRRNEQKQIAATESAPRIRETQNVKINRDAVTISQIKRKICQPLIRVVNARETDQRRNQAGTKNDEQRAEPEISRRFFPTRPPKQKRGKDCALQQTNEDDDAAGIEKINSHDYLF